MNPLMSKTECPNEAEAITQQPPARDECLWLWLYKFEQVGLKLAPETYDGLLGSDIKWHPLQILLDHGKTTLTICRFEMH